MKNKLAIITLCIFLSTCNLLFSQGTAFTYQGRLTSGGSPANGNYDLTFALFSSNSGIDQVGNTLTNLSTGVTNGLFSVVLDFGSQFNGNPLWLSVGVRTNGGANFTALTPLQELTPTPYATYANTASNVVGVVSASQLAGQIANNQLANNSITITAGTGLSGSGTVALGSSTTLNNSGVTSLTGGGGVTVSASSGSVALGSSPITVTAGTGLSGGGAVLLGGSTTLNNSGVTALTGGGGVTVSASSGSVTLGSTATSADTANTIVSRNGSGNFSAGSITLTGPLIIQNSDQNTPVGFDALPNNTGSGNTATGEYALYDNTSGSDNTGFGAYSLYSNTGNNNVAFGYEAASGMTGNNNIAIGYEAGLSSTPGSANIDIGNEGQPGDNGVIRIGTQGTQSVAFIAGISGVTISPSGGAVYVNAKGQLGTVNSSRRFKEGIQDMAGQSDILLSLRPVAFHYKADLDPQLTPQYGLIAEEVEKLAPQLVVRDDKGEVLSVRYEQINAMLLNEFLKEHKTVEAQNTEIQELKQSVAELKAMVEKLAGK